MRRGVDKIAGQGKEERALRQDILDDVEPSEYPSRLDWLASYLEQYGDYQLNLQRGTDGEFISRFSFPNTAEDPYRQGLAALLDDRETAADLSDRVGIAKLVQQYAALVTSLSRVDRQDVDPGEVLSRLVVRRLQRQSGDTARLAEGLQPNTRTPRELLLQLANRQELADGVESFIQTVDDDGDIPAQLGRIRLATQLWPHQRKGLAKWLKTGGKGYVDMATATGKTVLGLAAVGYCTNSGALHPSDQAWLEDWFDETPPQVSNQWADNVLIVTTDDLLGAQWARLFEQHCHTPPEYTKIEDGSIRLPWGRVDIRAANGLDGIDPGDYQLAIFDEVHNYGSADGWGGDLKRFVNSACPVLALTGSETQSLVELSETSDQPFDAVFTYSHADALADGVIPEFEWTLAFVPVDEASSSTLERLLETAAGYDNLVDDAPGSLWLSDAALEQAPPGQFEGLTSEYETPGQLASAIRAAGEDDQGPTPSLDQLARGLDGRRAHWWNLRPALESIRDRLQAAMAAEQPALVLTRSYPEAETIATLVETEVDADTVTTLKQGQSASAQEDDISAFDEVPTGQKVLIGPGKRLGTGVDIQTVEVGINLAQPGTGVNASLVQRLGRLLRKTDTDTTVEFYHVLGVPPTEGLIPTDGMRFVTDVTEFFAQAEVPGTDGMAEPPEVTVADEATAAIVELEQTGAAWRQATADQLPPLERSYIDAIEAQTATGTSVVATDWYETDVDTDDSTADADPDSGTGSGTDAEPDTATDSTNGTRDDSDGQEATATTTTTAESS